VRGIEEAFVKKALFYQAALTLLLAAGLAVTGAEHGYSALIGGGIAAVANGLFALWVFQPYRAQQPGHVVARMYSAELVKLAFVALAFVGVFLWVEPLSAAALFGCFLVVHLVPALTAARASTGRRKR
jgi:F0F1-type ATP synthase assembly protein I